MLWTTKKSLPWSSLSSAEDGDVGSQKWGWTYIPEPGLPLLTPYRRHRKDRQIIHQSGLKTNKKMREKTRASTARPKLSQWSSNIWAMLRYFWIIATTVGSWSMPHPDLSTSRPWWMAPGSNTITLRLIFFVCKGQFECLHFQKVLVVEKPFGKPVFK